MNYHALMPLDAWFFRDGRPYNEKESNQDDVESIFPPPARTLTGAVRAALARGNGWDGRSRWSDSHNQVFGSGPDDLGKLQFTGPFLIHGKQALWPVPKHVLGRVIKQEWNPSTFLLPAGRPTICDLGEVRLPEIALSSSEDRTGLKPAEIGWVTRPGLESLLAARIPPAESIVSQATLWMLEPRVGLRREEAAFAVPEGGLYSPSYVRLRRDTMLGFGVFGVPDEMKGVADLFPLGGESRLASCEVWNGDPLPSVSPRQDFTPTAEGKIEFVVVLLTPGRFHNGEPQLKNATKVSACVGKPQYFGGWDSLAQKPLPLQPFAPAGSVWFFETPTSNFPAIHSQHGQWLGEFTAHGFGQIAIGHWPRSSKTLTSP